MQLRKEAWLHIATIFTKRKKNNKHEKNPHVLRMKEKNGILLKFGHSEKDTKFEKIFHLKFDVTQ